MDIEVEKASFSMDFFTQAKRSELPAPEFSAALRSDALAFFLKQLNPAAKRRLAKAERAAGFDVAVVFLEREVGDVTFEFSSK